MGVLLAEKMAGNLDDFVDLLLDTRMVVMMVEEKGTQSVPM